MTSRGVMQLHSERGALSYVHSRTLLPVWLDSLFSSFNTIRRGMSIKEKKRDLLYRR